MSRVPLLFQRNMNLNRFYVKYKKYIPVIMKTIFSRLRLLAIQGKSSRQFMFSIVFFNSQTFGVLGVVAMKWLPCRKPLEMTACLPFVRRFAVTRWVVTFCSVLSFTYIRCKHVVALIYKLYCCFEKRNKSYFPFNRLIKVIKKKLCFLHLKKKLMQ